MIEQSHYNTYSSARYSNHRRTMYLALNRRGQPRKVQIRAQQQLGKLSTYTRVLTQSVSPERVEELISRLAAAHAHVHPEDGTAHPLRHHGSAAGHLCAVASAQAQRHSPGDQPGVDRLRCRRRKKRKKKRRKCPDDKDASCPNKPFGVQRRKCADGSEPPCTEKLDKPTPNVKRKCSSDDEDVACNDKPNKPPLNPKRKCSSDGADDDVPCPPKKNATQCENTKDECQRIPNNKLVNKKNNKKNRFAQNVQLRVNKKKNKKLKTLKNKKGINKKAVEVTSTSRSETTTFVTEASSETSRTASWSSSSTTEPMETSSTSDAPDTVAPEAGEAVETVRVAETAALVTSDEDYSSPASSSASEEADSSPAASWEDPFIPPYPEPTSEATPM